MLIMLNLQNLDFTKIGIIAGAALVGVIIIVILLSKFVFKRSKCKKHLKDCENKFSYLKSLLTGQDSQNVLRLEVISRSNLLYGEIYDSFSNQFKTILDNECKNADQSLSKLRQLVVKKDFKSFKKQYNETKRVIASFEDRLLDFDKQLCNTLKPEENCRTESVKIKERYRIIKQKASDNMSAMELVRDTFVKIYGKIEDEFDKFERSLECADYQEAEAILPRLSQVLNALDNATNSLPTLCSQVEKIIPEKIMILGTDFIDVEKSGLPLFHLAFKMKSEGWNNELASIANDLKELKINGAQEKLDYITKEIDNLRVQLEQEILDKKFFEEHVDIAYEKVVVLEKNFLKIIAVLPKIKEIYVISTTQTNNLEILKKNIDDLDVAKRALDNYIHSSTKQPFSVLKSKLDQLIADYDIAFKGVEDFKVYIESIKTNSEDAYGLVFNYYYRLKQIEAIVREFNIPALQSRYEEPIEHCYELLNIIDDSVKTRPIDVAFVNEKVEELKNVSKRLFEDVEKQAKDMKIAEAAIVYNNSDRPHQSDVNEKLLKLEEDFFKADFEKVFHSANEIYKEKHVEDKK